MFFILKRLFNDIRLRIITLTTDFGERDYSVGAVKGAIYSKIPDGNVVDISHGITPFDIFQTAYILKNTYIHFPKETIHLIGVDSERTSEKRHLMMKLNGHYFIGADNGIFHLLSENQNDFEIYDLGSERPATLFPALDFFPEIIAEIHKGIPLDKIGERTDSYLKMNYFKPQVSNDKSFIFGEVIYIDHYGNVISNISRSLFEEIGQNRPFEIIFKMHSLNKIYSRYSDIINFSENEKRRFVDGKMMAIFNSTGYLQCSIYKSNLQTVGGASSLLGIDISDTVSIRFM